jgi:hypothetical protein
MNEPKVRKLLSELSPRVDEMHDILSREMPENAYTWKTIGEEVRDLAAQPYPPQDVEAFARRTLSIWGVGMGSFSDTFVTHRFEEVRDEVQALLEQLQDAAREGEVNTLAVRRHLTTLETVLLETHHEAEATRARALLNANEMDCAAAARLASELEARTWTAPASARVPAIVGALKAELAQYVAVV